MRRVLAKALMSTGMLLPFGFSNNRAGSAALHCAVGELGDLEVRIDFERNALQFARIVEGANELTQVLVSHGQYRRRGRTAFSLL